MKIAVPFFCLCISVVTATAQQRDSVYINSSKKLVLKSAPKTEDRSFIQINGKEYTGPLESIDINSITGFDMMKAEDAAVIFGPKAKNGAVLFQTADPEESAFLKKMFEQIKTLTDAKDPNRFELMVNHVFYKGSVNDIVPYDIKNVDKVNAEEALSLYGVKVKTGMLLISTSQQIDAKTGMFIK